MKVFREVINNYIKENIQHYDSIIEKLSKNINESIQSPAIWNECIFGLCRIKK